MHIIVNIRKVINLIKLMGLNKSYLGKKLDFKQFSFKSLINNNYFQFKDKRINKILMKNKKRHQLKNKL